MQDNLWLKLTEHIKEEFEYFHGISLHYFKYLCGLM